MIKIADSHNDFIIEITGRERDCYLFCCQNAGVEIISSAVFTTSRKLNINDIKKYADEIDLLNKKFNVRLLLSIEDLGFIQEDELSDLIHLKPFSCTLTWNNKNKLAGGAKDNGGITAFGKKVINLLEENNIFVDTAHLNRQSFYEFAKMTNKPIFNSHSNIYKLRHHKRNLTDKQIELIVKSDGYLGLTIYDEFISKAKVVDEKTVALQFDYLIKKFGHRNFGLGTDFYGIDNTNLPKDIKGYDDISKISNELINLGYNSEIIECLIGKNFENFLKRNHILK